MSIHARWGLTFGGWGGGYNRMSFRFQVDEPIIIYNWLGGLIREELKSGRLRNMTRLCFYC